MQHASTLNILGYLILQHGKYQFLSSNAIIYLSHLNYKIYLNQYKK